MIQLLTQVQTANKTLEEIDLIFLTKEEKADLELSLAHPEHLAKQQDESKDSGTAPEHAENAQPKTVETHQ